MDIYIKKIKRLLVLLLILGMGSLILGGCSVKDNKSSSSEKANNSSSSNEEDINGVNEYPHDIAKDRKTFKDKPIEIVVGDKLYATQINDWYANMKDYVGKTVEIEGYYIIIGPYTYLGRLGPSCPYCKGGYVSFEFKGDQDLSKLKSEISWIKVQGILREGNNSIYGPFQYIEAINVEVMPEAGVTTVTN